MKFRSAMVTSVAGSIGGITFFNGRFGHMVARARSIPTQPGSTPQTQIRTAWSNAQGLWVNATPTTRLLWEQYAATVTYQGSTGSYQINGRERFLATLSLISYLNTVLGLSIPATAAAPGEIGWLLLSDLATSAPTLAETGFSVDVGNPNSEPIEVSMAISQGLPETINFWKGPWDTETLDSINLPALSSGSLEFQGLVDGKVYFIRIRAVNSDTGHRISEQFILRAIAEVGT